MMNPREHRSACIRYWYGTKTYSGDSLCNTFISECRPFLCRPSRIQSGKGTKHCAMRLSGLTMFLFSLQILWCRLCSISLFSACISPSWRWGSVSHPSSGVVFRHCPCRCVFVFRVSYAACFVFLPHIRTSFRGCPYPCRSLLTPHSGSHIMHIPPEPPPFSRRRRVSRDRLCTYLSCLMLLAHHADVVRPARPDSRLVASLPCLLRPVFPPCLRLQFADCPSVGLGECRPRLPLRRRIRLPLLRSADSVYPSVPDRQPVAAPAEHPPRPFHRAFSCKCNPHNC